MEVWDVTDPTTPTLHGEASPDGGLHDVVVDPVRDFAHLAYIGPKAELDAYVILDTSDPWNPTEVGRFDYAGEPDYDEVDVGEEAFENCHYANYDPNRDLAVVGDELGFGNPGGKHVFDIGWGAGSPSDPQPIGFTLSPNAEPMDDPDEPSTGPDTTSISFRRERPRCSSVATTTRGPWSTTSATRRTPRQPTSI